MPARLPLPPSAERLLAQFAEFLDAQQLSRKTTINYLSDVRGFLHARPEASQQVVVVLSAIQEHKRRLLEVGTPLATINRHLASLRQFAAFLNTVHHLEIHPAAVQNITMHPKTGSVLVARDLNARLVNNFVSALRAEHCSPSTVKNYAGDIGHFAVFLEEISLLDIQIKPRLHEYWELMRSLEESPATLKRRQSSLRRFYSWATASNYLKANPFPPSFPQQIQNLAEDVPNILAPLQKSQEESAQLLEKRNEVVKSTKSGESAPFPGLLSRLFGQPSRPTVPMVVLALLVSLMGSAAYRQFFAETPLTTAFPTQLTRPNRILSFQGRLTDSVGTPITVATNVKFRLFNHITNGTGDGQALWASGTCSITPDSDGVFNTLLGSSCGSEIPASVFSENRDIYLELEVAGETLTPRQQIATVGYALNSETLQGYPASRSAVENTVLVMNEEGDVLLGSSNPRLLATGSGTFTVSADSLTLNTNSTGGDITLSTLSDSANGQVKLFGDVTTQDYLTLTNSSLTTGTMITADVGNDNSGYKFVSFTGGSSPSEKFSVNARGNVFASGFIGARGATLSAQISSDLPLVINGTGGQIVSVTNAGNLSISGDFNTTGTYRMNGTDYGQYFIGSAGNNGEVWKSDGTGAGFWGTVSSGSGGTVTSVGLVMPSEFTVTNSPVTSAGNLTTAWASQTANYVFAAPNGSAGTPTFRGLVDADIPDTITASNYVLKAGDTMTGNLAFNTGSITTVQGIGFNTAVTTAPAEGFMNWNDDRGLMEIGLKGGYSLEVGEQIVKLAKNQTGSPIAKGKIVYINGGSGNRPTIALASNAGEGTSSKTFGITGEAIANGQSGYVVVFGPIYGLNTASYSAGQTLYLGTNGDITNTKPTSPSHMVAVAKVINVHATEGVIEVNIQNGFEVSELHDVQLTATASGDVLSYDASTQLWKNRALSSLTSNTAYLSLNLGTYDGGYNATQSAAINLLASSANTASYLVARDASGNFAANGITANLLTSTGALTLSSAASGNIAILPNGTGNVGIGTSSPNATLDVAGTASVSGTLTVGNGTTNQIRSAFGPLSLMYKSGADAWTAGLTLNELGNAVFSGRVQGSNAVNSNEFVTLGQVAAGAGQYWQLNAEVLSPYNSTLDLVLGGTATNSAKFQVFGATGNATMSGTLTFAGASTIATRNNGLLTLGDAQTGNIAIANNLRLDTTGTGATNTVLTLSAGNIVQNRSIDSRVWGSTLVGNTGTTTANYLTKWSNGNTITNSQVFDDGTNVGVGTANPTQALDVRGRLTISDQGGGLATDSAAINVNYLYNPSSFGSYGQSKFSFYGDDENGSSIQFFKSRASVLGAYQALQEDDLLGWFRFAGPVSSSSAPDAAQIRVAVDGTPGTLLPSRLSFYTSNGSTLSETMRLNKDGNLGIGVTSSTLAKLHVAGAGIFTGTVQGSDAVNSNEFVTLGQVAAGAGQYWQLNAKVLSPYNSTLDLVLGGTATSSAKFQVFGATGNATMSGTLTFAGASTIATRNSGNLTLGDAQTGNVGIGTASPNAKLDITGSNLGSTRSLMLRSGNDGGLNSSSQIVFSWGGSATNIYAHNIRSRHNGTADNQNALDFYVWDFGTDANTALGSKFVMTLDGGNVGIGTTAPTGLLHVNGAAIGKAAMIINETGNQNILAASSSGTTRFVIDNNGNVGIGTNTPGARLNVAGNATISGTLRADNYYFPTGGGGLFRGDTNQLMAFGTSNISVNGSYNFGVGTDNPIAKLDVAGNASISGTLTFAGASTIATRNSGNLTLGDAQTGNIVLADTVVLNALSAGNTDTVLTLNANNIAANRSIDTRVWGSTLVGNTGTTTANYLTKWSNGNTITNSQVFDDGTNVGIGTDTPTALLDVKSTTDTNARMATFAQGNATATQLSFWQMSRNTTGGDVLFAQLAMDNTTFGVKAASIDFRYASELGANVDAQADIAFSTGSTERMRIMGNTGRVGIGTANPSNKLHVVGDANSFQELFKVSNANSGISAAASLTVSNGSGQIDLGKIGTGASSWAGYGAAGDSFLYSSNAGGGDLNIINAYGTGDINFATGGNLTTALRMKIESGGNVGIGTPTPLSRLHLFSNQANMATISIVQSGTKFLTTFTNTGSDNAILWNNTSALRFGTGSNEVGLAFSEYMRIASNGNVSIGSTSTSTSLLRVGADNTAQSISIGGGTTYGNAISTDAQNDLKIRGVSGGSDYWEIDGQTSSPDAGTLYIRTGDNGTEPIYFAQSTAGVDTVRLAIGSTGNVGIGTTTPTGLLHVNGAALGKAAMIINETGNQNILTASASGTTRLVIQNDGNVGIGTSSPSNQLDIGTATAGNQSIRLFSAGNFDTEVKFREASDGFGFDLGYDGTNNNFFIDRRASLVNTNVITIPRDSGNIGIGTTTPTGLLHVNGAAIGKAAMIINETGNQNILTASASGTTRLVIQNDGNVGIGTISPEKKITIVGVNDKDSGPILALAGAVTNQVESGRIRFQENANGSSYQGAFIHYDGSANILNIGMHETADALTTSDVNAISILRGTRNVGIGTTTPTGLLHVNGAAIGKAAMIVNETGNQNILAASSSGTTRLTLANNGTLTVVGPSVTCVIGTGTGATNCTSDSRLKTNIVRSTNDLNKILSLNPVRYNWVAGYGDQKEHLGLIAQEVQQHYPEFVSNVYDDYLGVDYAALATPLIGAIQQQHSLIQNLESVSLNASGNVVIAGQADGSYSASLPNGTPVTASSAFQNSAIANLRAGLVDALTLKVDGKPLTQVVREMVEDVLGSSEVQVLSGEKLSTSVVEANTVRTTTLQATDSSALAIRLDPNLLSITANTNGTSTAVAQFDTAGNATFSGTVFANELNATRIAGLDALLEGSSRNTIELATAAANLAGDSAGARAAQQLLATLLAPQDASTEAILAELNSLSGREIDRNTALRADALILDTALDVRGVARLATATVTNALTVGGNLTLTGTTLEMALSNGSNPSFSDTFYIQPSGNGSLDLLAGVLKIQSGRIVTVDGDLYVTGKIHTKEVLTTSLNINQPATVSATATGPSLLGALLKTYDEQGNVVAVIDASGSAKVAELNTRGIVIAAPNGTQQTIGGAPAGNATAGKAILPANQSEVVIANELVEPNTLIYLTPLANTQNKVLFVKNKIDGESFTVAVDSALPQDVEFNYWLIKVEQ